MPTQATGTQSWLNSYCEQYRPFYQTLAAYTTYKANELNTDSLGAYISSGGLQSDLEGKTPDLSPAQMEERKQQNFTKLEQMENKMYYMNRCIQNDITQRSERAGEIYKLQDQVTEEQKKADEMEKTATDAKERANFVEHPYSKTSRHETWFPLGRPLKKESVPVLLSFAIVCLVLSLGMFLRQLTIQFHLESPFLAQFIQSVTQRLSGY